MLKYYPIQLPQRLAPYRRYFPLRRSLITLSRINQSMISIKKPFYTSFACFIKNVTIAISNSRLVHGSIIQNYFISSSTKSMNNIILNFSIHYRLKLIYKTPTGLIWKKLNSCYARKRRALMTMS